MDERLRATRQPYRDAYHDPDYKRNRLERYRLVGGRCESCGAPLKGDLYPNGVAWQCDHHIEARLFEHPRDANVIENLRCYCAGPGGCHVGKRKPRDDR